MDHQLTKPTPSNAPESKPEGNGTTYEDNFNRQLPNPKPQRNQAPTLGCAVQGEEEGLGRATVKFTGYRVRPLDPDNFAASIKDLLDGLRRVGFIIGDEPWRIKLETEQVKVASFKEERTVIEIDLPD